MMYKDVEFYLQEGTDPDTVIDGLLYEMSTRHSIFCYVPVAEYVPQGRHLRIMVRCPSQEYLSMIVRAFYEYFREPGSGARQITEMHFWPDRRQLYYTGSLFSEVIILRPPESRSIPP